MERLHLGDPRMLLPLQGQIVSSFTAGLQPGAYSIADRCLHVYMSSNFASAPAVFKRFTLLW